MNAAVVSHRSVSRVCLIVIGALLATVGCGSKTASSCNSKANIATSTGRPTTSQTFGAEAANPNVSPTHSETFTGREIARSVEDRPIVLREFQGPAIAGRPETTVLIFAGIHGSEPTTVFAAARLLELLERDAATVVPAGHRLVVVPVANPDGYLARKRQNARGIDLNRNFPASNFQTKSHSKVSSPGPSPLSEPESRAIHDLVLAMKPARILSMHSKRTPPHGTNYDGPARELAELMSSKNGYDVLPSIGYPTPGSFGSWAGTDLQIPTITLEFPARQSGRGAWDVNREAILAFIRGS